MSNSLVIAMLEMKQVVCFKRSVSLTVLMLIFCQPAAAGNDFPTRALAEYVFACMSSNDQTEVMLEKCSCSIDVIAETITYDEYVEAETVLRMRQLSSDRVDIFRNSEWANIMIDRYRKSQAEAEIRCF